VVGVESLRVASLKFLAPYPNPARAQARLSFVLPVAQERVELMLYDVSGRLVRAERMGAMQAGLHTWVWDGKDRIGGRVASGVYFARLSAGGETRTQKLLRLAP
jgi:flagellar hook assembly protein FlgD